RRQNAPAEAHRVATDIPDRKQDAVAEAVVPAAALGTPADEPELFEQFGRMTGGDGPAHQPVARKRGVAHAEAADGLAVEVPLAQIKAGGLGLGGVEQAELELLGGPPHHVKHTGAALVVSAVAVFF